MDIKRNPHRVVTLTKEDCTDLEEAIAYAVALMDKDFKILNNARDKTAANRGSRLRAALSQLRSAVVDID